MITYDLDTADTVIFSGRRILMEFNDHTVLFTPPRVAKMSYWHQGRRPQIILGSGRTMTTIVGRPVQIQELWERLTDSNPPK